MTDKQVMGIMAAIIATKYNDLEDCSKFAVDIWDTVGEWLRT